MSLTAQQKLERLVASLQALAMPFEEQVALFPEFVHIGDELALLFDDCMRLAEQLPEFGRFTPSQRAMLRELDQRFERLSGTKDPSFWTRKALQCDDRWDDIRGRAAEMLRSLGRAVETPDLHWLQFIEPYKRRPARRPSSGEGA